MRLVLPTDIALASILLLLPSSDGARNVFPKPIVKTIISGGLIKKSVDVVFVGDGYQKKHAAKFWAHTKRYAAKLLSRKPFVWYKKKFNVHGVFVPSRDSGCDMSLARNRVRTLLQSYFDSPQGRLLQFRDKKKLAELVKLAPDVDIVFVMVNVKKYGGAGTLLPEHQVRGRPLPAPTFAAEDTTSFWIAVHELGHSFANLADEYADPATAVSFPLPRKGKDLPEPNVTLPGHFDDSSFATLKKTIKWKHFLDLRGAKKHKWVHEGGHYRRKGVFRPWRICMMDQNNKPFCPVCMEEMAKAIMIACGEQWNDAAYHKRHPLRQWRE